MSACVWVCLRICTRVCTFTIYWWSASIRKTGPLTHLQLGRISSSSSRPVSITFEKWNVLLLIFIKALDFFFRRRLLLESLKLTKFFPAFSRSVRVSKLSFSSYRCLYKTLYYFDFMNNTRTLVHQNCNRPRATISSLRYSPFAVLRLRPTRKYRKRSTVRVVERGLEKKLLIESTSALPARNPPSSDGRCTCYFFFFSTPIFFLYCASKLLYHFAIIIRFEFSRNKIIENGGCAKHGKETFLCIAMGRHNFDWPWRRFFFRLPRIRIA